LPNFLREEKEINEQTITMQAAIHVTRKIGVNPTLVKGKSIL
jgi:hypothetical protein